MTAIYKPKGRAGEYADLACNLWLTCSHGCRYCYVPQILHKPREQFHITAAPRHDILEALRRDAPEYSGDPRRVLLCFACDPYQPHENGFTRQALEILVENNVRFSVLTKGGMRAVRDFDLYSDNRGWFGTTLLFTHGGEQWKYERNAPSILDRIAAIKVAHQQGIYTWVSIEPVIDPAQAIQIISWVVPHVDEFRVGKLNYHPLAATIDWQAFVLNVRDALEETGKPYLIKKDLAMYLPEETGRTERENAHAGHPPQPRHCEP